MDQAAFLLASLLLISTGPFAKQQEETVHDVTPAALQQYVAVNAAIIALVGVNVVDGTGAPPLHNQTIVIKNGRIKRLGLVRNTAIPEKAQVMTLYGRTVIPGLVGMHNHTHMPGVRLQRFTAPRLYLASGVTTIQTKGSADAHGEIELSQAIAEGKVPGPQMFSTAPYVTGPGGNSPMFMPVDEAEARAFVDNWADAGATWIKLYRHVEPSIANAIIEQAHLREMKVSGHLCSLTYREAALMGIDSIEHGLLSVSDFIAGKPAGKCVENATSLDKLEVSGEPVAKLISILIANDVTLTSTLAIMESHFPHRPQGDVRALRAMSSDLVDVYRRRQLRLSETAAETRYQPELWEKIVQFERIYFDSGGQIVAGPDIGRHVLPGYGDQRNFELLVEAGFTTPQAVTIMTFNGARELGISDQTGLIAAGYIADMVVLNGNLADNPSIIRRVEYVFKGGIGFDPRVLVEHTRGRIGID